MKKILLIKSILIGLAIILLTACGGGGSNSNSSTNLADDYISEAFDLVPDAEPDPAFFQQWHITYDLDENDCNLNVAFRINENVQYFELANENDIFTGNCFGGDISPTGNSNDTGSVISGNCRTGGNFLAESMEVTIDYAGCILTGFAAYNIELSADAKTVAGESRFFFETSGICSKSQKSVDGCSVSYQMNGKLLDEAATAQLLNLESKSSAFMSGFQGIQDVSK